jgi:hypothetical protein
MHKSQTVGLLCTLTLLFLGGCAFAPELALLQEIRDMDQRWTDMHVLMDSVAILQRQEWQGRPVYQVRFEAIREGGQRQECLFVYETHRRWGWWTIGGAGGGCGPVGGSGTAIQVSWGRQGAGLSRPALSHVDGLVYDPSVTTIEVTWSDGEEQQVEATNGGYLVLRGGSYVPSQVRALNATGEVVYTFEPSPPPQGKQ